MLRLPRKKIYPSEDEAEALSESEKFVNIVAMAVEEGCSEAINEALKANVILFRRIGPYVNSRSASRQANYVKKRYHPDVDGIFETHTVVDSRDKRPDRKNARHFLMVHFWPNESGRGIGEDGTDEH